MKCRIHICSWFGVQSCYIVFGHVMLFWCPVMLCCFGVLSCSFGVQSCYVVLVSSHVLLVMLCCFGVQSCSFGHVMFFWCPVMLCCFGPVVLVSRHVMLFWSCYAVLVSSHAMLFWSCCFGVQSCHVVLVFAMRNKESRQHTGDPPLSVRLSAEPPCTVPHSLAAPTHAATASAVVCACSKYHC